MPNQEKKNLGPLFIIFLWGIYGFIYFYLKNSQTDSNIFGWISFFISAILTYIAVHLSSSLWQRTTGKMRQIFGLFSLSIIFGFLSNLIYQILFNVLNVSHNELSNILLSSYNLPYMALLLLQSTVWLLLLQKIKLFKNKGPSLYLIIILFSFLLAFALDYHLFLAKEQSLDLNKSYDLIELFLQITGFLAALLCFLFAKNRGIFYLALSFVIIIGSDLTMNFGFFSQTYGVKSIVEIGWILGVFFRIYGLYTISKTKLYEIAPEKWTYIKTATN